MEELGELIDIDSKPVIKIEVKDEYEEQSFSDDGCLSDPSIDPYFYDGQIKIKDEPCDFDEEWKKSVKVEIKEEFPSSTNSEEIFLCYHCEEKFFCLESLRLHIRCHLHSSSPNPFKKITVKKRRKCKYKYSDSSKNHIRTDHLTKIWLCKLCAYETNHPGSLRKHVRAHHTDPFSHHQCNMCKFESPVRRELMAHLLKHEEMKLLQCLFCNYRASKLRDLKNHERDNHIGKDKYLCQFCNFKGKTRKLLKKHMTSEHQNEKQHMCQFCPYNTSRRGDLKRHIMSLHLDLKLYQCKMCDYKAVKTGDLNRHFLSRHSDKKPFKCDLCDYKAKRAEHLRSHLLSHDGSNGKHHLCELCSYKTLYRSSLRRHVKMKHIQNGESFRCSLCDFWSPQLDVIQKHIHEDHF